ncbi:MAG: GNAT family N-acetyltransferase [Chitinophagales bacterium]|nr:GNAT family N-acetyltransferase [Chitinophagales bacterium]
MKDILIRKTTEEEIDEIVSIEANKENQQFIISNTRAEHLQLLQDKGIAHLIVKSRNNQTIGFVILGGMASHNQSIEFRRIVINEKGKGYGRKVIQSIKKYCFEELKCHRLWLDVLENNVRARHLYKTEGFVEEGILRECLLLNGKFQSLVLMSILKNEYDEGIQSKFA